MYKNVHYITAGAGAGKTTKLVNIITDLVQNKGAKPERMILTTYTDATANEFREKSKAALPADKALEMNSAQIGTLHSIASTYIHRYWYLLGISPEVRPMTDEMSKILMNRSLEDVVTGEDISLFNKYVETFGLTKTEGGGYDYDFWKATMIDLFSKMRDYGFNNDQLHVFKDKTLEALQNTFNLNINESVFEQSKGALMKYLSYETIVSSCGKDAGKNQYQSNCKQIREILETDPNEVDMETVNTIFKMRWGRAAVIDKNGKLKDEYDPILKDVHNEIKVAVDYLIAHLVPIEANLIIEVTDLIFQLMKKWMKNYSDIKKENGVIDFTDMEHLFYNLLQNQVVLEDIKKSIDYLFVDEFQDSSPIQANIYAILSNNIEQSWFVGDRKQAIYGFRGSDAGLIGELAEEFPKARKNVPAPKDSNGNSAEILSTSHRSVPRLVKMANDIFIKAFDELNPDSPTDQIPVDQVYLDWDKDKSDPQWESLYHVCLEGNNNADKANALATFLCSMVNHQHFSKAGYKASDIAVLCRSKNQVKEVVSALKGKGIITAAINPDEFIDTPEVSLVLDILKLSDDIDSAKCRAEIRKILKEESLNELASRIKGNMNSLDEFPGLKSFIQNLRTLSIPDRIDAIVSRFDLYGISGNWDSPEARRNNIILLRQAAVAYTDKSMLLCSAADVRGFLSFLKDFKPDPKFDNTAEGIKVLTYHKAKGLQWKIVVLYGLNKYNQKGSISGISIVGRRSAPDYLLAIPRLPDKEWVKDCIQANSSSEEILRKKQAEKKGEERRLLYVGFTRAEDVVITAADSNEPEVIRTLCPTACERTATPPDADHVDIWGIDGYFSRLITVDNDPDIKAVSNTSPVRYKDAGFYLPAKKADRKEKADSKQKYNSPSLFKDKDIQQSATIETAKDFGGRMDIPHSGLDDNEFGDCLHHLFAICAPGNHQDNIAAAQRTMKAFGIDDTEAPEKVVSAIENFFEWLTAKYGPVTSLDSEVPFQYTDAIGRMFSGNMDLIWNTEKGAVLVDYKTFPGKRADLFDKNSKHWAGKYASQLSIYSKALTSKDKRAPLDTILFYPVEGLAIRLM